MMKRKLLLIITMFVSLCIKAQSKYTADRYFKEFDYPKAVELYTQMHKKGDNSELVLSRIADAYYFNVDTKNAEKWYKMLVDKHKNVSPEHLFRYAQTLKSNGNYELSDEIMKRLDQVDEFDSRSDKLLATQANYVELYSKESGDVLGVKNVSTNTKYSDFGGFGVKDVFYFASTIPTKSTKGKLYKWNRQPFLNLYKAKVTTTDTSVDLKDKELLSEPIQTHYHEASAVIAKSGRVMYFTRDNFDGETTKRSKERRVNLKLYRAIRKNGKWTDVKELPFNSNEYSVGHPALSTDEKTLYFVSNMPGGYGSTDIYKVAVFANNKFGEPENLGSKINTEGREMFPFVSSENTLYFSSDGHLGLGALDIFESKIDEENNFGKVTNIKAPFNSNLDDFGFWINKEYTQGFFSSNRKGGKGDDDIYSFTLDRTARPDNLKTPVVTGCKQIITGLVTEARSGKIMPNTTVKLLDKEGKVINQVVSDANGLYTLNVDCEQGYKVLASATDYRPDFKSVFTTPETNYSNRADLSLRALIVGNEIKLNPIYFDLDKSFIRPDAEYELENIVSVMRNHPEMKIRIESHTDSRATREYNRDLSDRRAKSTRDFIISRGISSARIVSAVGYGEDRLLNRCDDANANKCTEAEHQKNRRSYFYIVE